MVRRRRILSSGINPATAEVFTEPNEISGLQYWHRSDDAASITSASNRVSAWADQGADAGRSFDQSVGADQPFTGLNTVNGLNVLRFDNNEFLEHASDTTADIFGASPTGGTVIVSAQKDQTTGQLAYLIRHPRDATFSRFFHEIIIDWNGSYTVNAIRADIRLNSGAGAPIDGTGLILDDTPFVVSHDFDTTDANLWVNGASVGTAATGAALGYSPDSGDGLAKIATNNGSQDHFDGTIQEIAVWNRKLTDAERESIEATFGNRSGITIT